MGRQVADSNGQKHNQVKCGKIVYILKEMVFSNGRFHKSSGGIFQE